MERKVTPYHSCWRERGSRREDQLNVLEMMAAEELGSGVEWGADDEDQDVAARNGHTPTALSKRGAFPARSAYPLA